MAISHTLNQPFNTKDNGIPKKFSSIVELTQREIDSCSGGRLGRRELFFITGAMAVAVGIIRCYLSTSETIRFVGSCLVANVCAKLVAMLPGAEIVGETFKPLCYGIAALAIYESTNITVVKNIFGYNINIARIRG